MENEKKLFPKSAETLEIGGKPYTFEFCWKGLVEMEDKGVDFERLTRLNNIEKKPKELLKRLDVVLYGTLYKNHKLSLPECEELANKIFEEKNYAIDQLYFMFYGLYSAVFTDGGKEIPLAKQTVETLMKTIDNLKAQQDKLEKAKPKEKA